LLSDVFESLSDLLSGSVIADLEFRLSVAYQPPPLKTTGGA